MISTLLHAAISSGIDLTTVDMNLMAGAEEAGDMNLMAGAEEAGVEMMTSCFDKKFEAAGSVIRLLLSWLLPQFLPWLLSLLLPVLTLCVPVTFLF